MAKLSKAAIAMLQEAGCSEVADDYLLMGNTDVRVLLSTRAVHDLNAQARGDDVAPAAKAPFPSPTPSSEPVSERPAVKQDPFLEGIMNRSR